MPERGRAAYHEAGHAVVGLRCGARLLFVQVDEGGLGQCSFERSTLTDDRPVRIAMAGPAAEYIYAHPNTDGFALADCNASADDLRDVDNYCANFRPEERQQVREQHWAATCGILVSSWGYVMALASAILDQECLGADAVAARLRATGNWPEALNRFEV